MGLFDTEHYEPDDMLAHPRHLALQLVLATLIQQLRDCETVEAGAAFQHDLFTRLYEVEKDRRGFKRAADRVRGGKAVHLDAPEPQSGRDLADLSTWVFEHDLCERLWRQLRTVGDALAWRVFGFHRPFILALSRNDPPGPMYGKAGLQAELDEVEAARKRGVFALHHDLTNCLRIGDITVFDDATAPRTVEIKSDRNRKNRAQLERINAARAAVLNGGPLPGDRPSEVLYDLNLPLRTHLDLLRTATEQAATEGIVATELPGSRALLLVDQSACATRGLTPEQFLNDADQAFRAALGRAGIGDHQGNNIHATSLDITARSPQRVPWANYPLPPAACARLIGDYTVMKVETSGPALARLLQLSGLDARWVRSPGRGDLLPGEVVMEVSRQEPLRSALLAGRAGLIVSRTLQMRQSELDRYLIELVRPGMWVAGIKHLLASAQTGQPWPHYRDEDQVWC